MTKDEIILLNLQKKQQFYALKGGIIVAEKKKIAKDIEELTKQFDDVNSKYNFSNSNNKMENNLNLTKLDNVEIDNDEITKLAKNSLRDYYLDNIESINHKNDTKIENLENSIKQNKTSSSELKNKVNNTINQVKQDASNDAIKRGLARSSIVINQLNAFDNKKIEEYNKIDKELTDSVNKLNSEIDNLNAEKEIALNEFDITYASKLNEKINTLKKELEDKQAEITKYNNEISQIEAKYEKEVEKFNNDAENQDLKNYIDLSEFVAKYGTNALNSVKNSENYENAYSYFSSLNKEDAKKSINDNAELLKRYLGSSYFNQLVNKFN